jgi:multidrug efflux pump subunit AcrA (membrane-fusion protein)
VRVPFTREQALLVPESALSTDQGGAYLLTVDDKDTVQYHRVHTGAQTDGMIACPSEQ